MRANRFRPPDIKARLTGSANVFGPKRTFPLDESFVWHDPCELARGLFETTAPRALLSAAVKEFREPPRSGVDTSCCGAGGLLPRTMPEVAARLAEERRAELGGPAATSSPGCAAALGATEVVSILARWLQGAS